MTVASTKGQPASFWLIWLTAFAIIAGLMMAVIRYLSLPTAAVAHDHDATHALTRLGAPTDPGHLLGTALFTHWQLDVVAVAFVVLVGACYLVGVAAVNRRHRSSELPEPSEPSESGTPHRWPVGRTALFLAGLGLCVFATCGSIGVYDMALFSAHMLGHLSFVMAAPALLMAGRPIELAMLATKPTTAARLTAVVQGRVVSLLTAPPVALASYVVVIVGSHLTGLMDQIMRNPWAGQVEHLVYLMIGCQFFALIIGDAPIRWQLSTPARWGLLAISMAVDTFVGLAIMQSNRAVHMQPLPGMNVNTLSDTHTGGAIMWFGGDGVMAAIMILMVIGWLRDPSRQRADNYGWFERARRGTFEERVSPGSSSIDDIDFDDHDERLDAYNAWLADLHKSSQD